ncbi:hypothetical protein TNIN_94041 [Trichonephila inaurata madagascariensis]|uniref:Uncharacterized protein n=1 Tax=Trichonephila inaurata madagascariensis TaxID=2747483 RepID=A0A8X6IAN3_9ARAC|nr:hypothetical protein TNIN_94041 [Trichonephila inaurata madagascariensis]
MGKRRETSTDVSGVSDCEGAFMRRRDQRLFSRVSSNCRGSAFEKMVTFTLQNSSIKKQQSVIQFLTAEGVKLDAIHRRGGCDFAPSQLTPTRLQGYTRRIRQVQVRPT